jgi:Cdc6-like AAA superfamily ATPase
MRPQCYALQNNSGTGTSQRDNRPRRAVRALKFGLGIRNQGFNIYVAGYPGTGRKTAVKNLVEEIARVEPVPPDWCYVNNFANQYEPKAIQLPAGKGKEFPSAPTVEKKSER